MHCTVLDLRVKLTSSDVEWRVLQHVRTAEFEGVVMQTHQTAVHRQSSDFLNALWPSVPCVRPLALTCSEAHAVCALPTSQCQIYNIITYNNYSQTVRILVVSALHP